MLFNDRKRCLRYLGCIALGAPTWFTLGVVVIFSPEIGASLGIATPIKASTAVMSYFIGSTLGNLISGLLSQFFKTRKKVLAFFLAGNIATGIIIGVVLAALVEALLMGVVRLARPHRRRATVGHDFR